MRFLDITTVYPEYLKKIYKQDTALSTQPYAQQLSSIYQHSFGRSNFLINALNNIGYQSLQILVNARSLQHQWAKENGIINNDLNEIAFHQALSFKPEIIFYDHPDEQLLLRLKTIASVKLVIGFSGSAIPETNVWKHMDMILSCAPEAVTYFNSEGHYARHLHHAFDPRVLTRIKDTNKSIGLAFIGQLIRASHYHLQREKLLEELLHEVDAKIFSDVPDHFFALARYYAKSGMFKIYSMLKKMGWPDEKISRLPLINKNLRWKKAPYYPVNKKLLPYIAPAVYGLEMYQTIKNSELVLNIHADSSPLYASNMRLFETTGVGSCLVSDWKKNIEELFEPDTEIVTYRSPEECIEKISWLKNNPAEIEKIAKAGQQRTLKDHTFNKRVLELDYLIKERFKQLS